MSQTFLDTLYTYRGDLIFGFGMIAIVGFFWYGIKAIRKDIRAEAAYKFDHTATMISIREVVLPYTEKMDPELRESMIAAIHRLIRK